MPITIDDLISRYPVLYHMADSGSWGSIQQHGLLSTTALLDLFQITGDDRSAIESARRTESVVIRHPSHGVAVIRDQKPMNETKLRECLIEMQPSQWYETLNRKVFFWLTEARLVGLLRARAYRSKNQVIITVDTAALLRRHLHRTSLSPINSGSTLYTPVRRGEGTFLPLHEYPKEWWRRRRVAELAVAYAVPDIADLACTVEVRSGSKVVETLYRSQGAQLDAPLHPERAAREHDLAAP